MPLDYTVDQAQTDIKAALTPLGPDYEAAARAAPSTTAGSTLPDAGQDSPAPIRAGGAYDVHPYMLLNYNGQYADMSALAHELGHTMQSYYSNENQPYPTADYPTFVAEVASTFNEALLIDHMLKTIDRPDRRSWRCSATTSRTSRGPSSARPSSPSSSCGCTRWREKGEPADRRRAVEALPRHHASKYYGHDQGVCIVDDYVAHEWAYIPHFYRPTSTSTSTRRRSPPPTALSEKVLAGDAGGAASATARSWPPADPKYPIDLLKDAGVDMTTERAARPHDARRWTG